MLTSRSVFTLLTFTVFVILSVKSDMCNPSQCLCDYVYNVRTHLPNFAADCSRLGLDLFPDETNFTGELHLLDLSHNAVEELDNIRSEFSSDTLEILKLSYNKISFISDEFFRYIPSLLEVDLSHNQIASIENEDIFLGVTHLKILDLSFNPIKTLPPSMFSLLTSLVSLSLSYTQLGNFMSNLNNIVNSTLEISTNLTHLEIANLGIEEFPNGYFDGLHHLKHLSLADNPIREVPVIPYSVEYLDLSGTSIRTLVARHLNYHSLKELKLNRVITLDDIEKYAFYNLQSLESLSLNDCPRLREFNDVAFGIILKDTSIPLKKLSIARSGLMTLNQTYANLFNKLEFVNLEFNQFKCNCNILWLRDFNRTLFHSENIRCATPLRFKDKQLMIMDINLFGKCTPERGSKLSKTVLPILGILIVLLVALIVYLIYMGPLIYKNRFVIAPRSPYHDITVHNDL